MNNQELKQAIMEDIEFLKTAKVDIIDKDTYYSKLKKYGWKTFGRLYLPVLILGMIFIKFSLFNREYDFSVQDYFISCAGLGLIAPVMVSLFFLPKIMNWIVFEEQLLPYLKTKDLIQTYVKKFFDLYFKFYLIWIAVGMFIFNSVLTFAINGTAIIFVTLGVHLMLYAELNRIGASVFFEYLSDFFDKEITRLPYK
jgi:hypothetical protein